MNLFGTNLFGTDGIRQTVGKSPLTESDLNILAKAISFWANKKYGNNINCLIVCDTRESCDWIKLILKKNFLEYSISVYDVGIAPTPSIFHILKNDSKFSFAIAISASHNQYQDNGIKIVDAQSGKLNLSDEIEITKLFNEKKFDQKQLQLGQDVKFSHGLEIYKKLVMQNFKPNFLVGKKVVLDLANGATYAIATSIFNSLGAEVIAINNIPDGKNINKNCGAVDTSGLEKEVIRQSADIGLAFDGDGDRVIAVNKFGIKKDGDDILALLIENPEIKKNDFVVGTIMTNQGLEVYLNQKNIKLIRTPVGDKYIAEELNKQNGILGGEQSGHIIVKTIINTGDGIAVGLKILETLIISNNWGMESFKKFPQVAINIKVTEKPDLTLEPFKSIIENSQKNLKTGRIVVRYSGTEPILRVMVEEENNELAKKIAIELSDMLQKNL